MRPLGPGLPLACWFVSVPHFFRQADETGVPLSSVMSPAIQKAVFRLADR